MNEFLKRVSTQLSEHGLGYLLLFKPVNVRYFSRMKIDYSAAIVTKDSIYLVVHLLETERASYPKELKRFTILCLSTERGIPLS